MLDMVEGMEAIQRWSGGFLGVPNQVSEELRSGGLMIVSGSRDLDEEGLC